MNETRMQAILCLALFLRVFIPSAHFFQCCIEHRHSVGQHHRQQCKIISGSNEQFAESAYSSSTTESKHVHRIHCNGKIIYAISVWDGNKHKQFKSFTNKFANKLYFVNYVSQNLLPSKDFCSRFSAWMRAFLSRRKRIAFVCESLTDKKKERWRRKKNDGLCSDMGRTQNLCAHILT